MADAAFPTAKYPGYTTAQLRLYVRQGAPDSQDSVETIRLMKAEIARREAVAAGDESQMTPGERLRHSRA